MTTDQATRPDGRPFTQDNRGRVPNLVIEDNNEGEAVLYHQFYSFVEPVGPRPYGIDEVYNATRRMLRRVKEARAGL